MHSTIYSTSEYKPLQSTSAVKTNNNYSRHPTAAPATNPPPPPACLTRQPPGARPRGTNAAAVLIFRPIAAVVLVDRDTAANVTPPPHPRPVLGSSRQPGVRRREVSERRSVSPVASWYQHATGQVCTFRWIHTMWGLFSSRRLYQAATSCPCRVVRDRGHLSVGCHFTQMLARHARDGGGRQAVG